MAISCSRGTRGFLHICFSTPIERRSVFREVHSRRENGYAIPPHKREISNKCINIVRMSQIKRSRIMTLLSMNSEVFRKRLYGILGHTKHSVTA